MPAFRAEGREVTTHRGLAQRRRLHPDAAGLPRRAGVPVRLLRRRHDHDRRRARRGRSEQTCRMRSRAISAAAPATARSPMRSHGIADVEEDIAGQACGASLRQPVRARRSSPARPATRWTSRWRGCCTSRCCARRTRMRASWRIDRERGARRAGRRRGLHLGGRAAPALQHRDARGPPGRSRTTPTCSTTSCASSASASPPWSPRPRPPPRRPAGCSTSTTRSCPPCSTRSRPCCPDAPLLHDKGVGAADGNIYVDIHGEVGSVADGLRRGRRRARGDLLHLPRAARAPGDARLHRLARRRRARPCPHQLAGAVHRAAEALPPVRPARRATCTCSPSASAAGSAASRRCSPRTSACSRR